MAYIGPDGTVIQHKPWSLKRVIDVFWSIIGFIVLFFRGLFHMDDAVTKGQYGQRPGGGPNAPGYPRRRMGGFRGGSSPPAPPCGPSG